MFLNGTGVIQDDVLAKKWFKNAAEQGHANAQINLGVMYYEEDHEAETIVYAYMWASLGASNGSENGKNFCLLPEKEMTTMKLSTPRTLVREHGGKNSLLS